MRSDVCVIIIEFLNRKLLFQRRRRANGVITFYRSPYRCSGARRADIKINNYTSFLITADSRIPVSAEIRIEFGKYETPR